MELDRWIRDEGALRADRAVGWALRLAKTLLRMHRRGMVHGRVSARAVHVDGSETFQSGQLLDPGEVDDDPQYHSPRRAEGGPPSEADDVWAAGITLYYAITGTLPFKGTTDADVKARIDWLPASPIADHGCEAPDVQELLDRLLSTKHDDPITNARQLRIALRTLPGGNDQLPPLDVSERIIVRLAAIPSSTSQDVISEWLMEDDSGHEIADEISTDDFLAPAKRRTSAAPVEPTDSADDLVAATPTPVDSSAVPAKAPVPLVAPRPAPPTFDEPAPSITPWRVGLVAAAAAGVAAAAYFGLRGDDEAGEVAEPPNQVTTATRATRSTGVQPEPARSTVPASRTAGAQAAATATPRAAPPTKTTAAKAPADLDACVISLFPEDTFSVRKPSFDFLCTESNPTEGALSMRSRLVWAGKGRAVTGGMKEWSQLYWYDMATIGMLQARCCADPPALIVPRMTPELAKCKLQDALAGFTRVVVDGSDDDVAAAVDTYTKSVRCLSKVGAARHFGYEGGLTGGEITFFTRFLERVRTAAR